ncbi:MAG TPA: hypothetical protein VLJ62_11265, partial [Burkholderiaceae bacterium]|nr:hypothetical protein [Burkholderiaceae bacterium]
DIVVRANDSSGITALTGAASLAASFGGVAGVSVSVAGSVARNEIGNTTSAYITNANGAGADVGVSTTAHYASSSTSAALHAGDRVKLAADYAVPDYTTGSVAQAADTTSTVAYDNTRVLARGDAVRLVADYTTTVDAGATTANRAIRSNDFVRLQSGYTGGGTAGAIYRYVGANPASGATIDLHTQNYADTTKWSLVGGTNDAIYAYVGTAGAVNLKTQDYSDTTKWARIAGTAGNTYRYLGADATRNLGAQDYSSTALWERVDTGDITITATETAQITATAAAASVAVGISIFGAGVGVSGAGADAKNVILTSTQAYVLGSGVASGRDLALQATNTAHIEATVAGLSAAAGGGAVAGAASIGAALATNLIGYTAAGAAQPAVVQAYISGGTASAVRDINVQAESSATIKATVAAGSVALTGGIVGIAAAGAGADAVNRIGMSVKGYIDGATVNAGVDVDVTAYDHSAIEASTTAASVAGAYGTIGDAVAIGVALSSNTIANTVEAYLLGATMTGVSGLLTVQATEDASVTGSAQAAAIAANVSLGGYTFAGGGAGLVAVMGTTTRAYVQGGSLTLAGDIKVDARNRSSVQASVDVTSAAFGVIAAAASGSVVAATVTPVVHAFISGAAVTADDVSVRADATPKIDLTASGLTISSGASVGVSKATAVLLPDVRAYVVAPTGQTLRAASLTVAASQSLPTTGSSASASAVGSAGGLLLGFDATVTQVTNTSVVMAYVGDNTTLDIAGATAISATSATRQRANSSSDAGGLIAIGLTSASAVANSTTQALLGNNVMLTGGSLAIGASSGDDNFSHTVAGAGGLGAGASASPVTRNTSTTAATIGTGTAGRGIDVSGRGTGKVEITAAHTATYNSLLESKADGFISSAGADTDHTITSHVAASVGDNLSITARKVDIAANNYVNRPALDGGLANVTAKARALVGVAGSFSDTVISLDTVVTVGDAAITVVGQSTGEALLLLRAFNQINTSERVTMEAGGLGAGARVDTTLRTVSDLARVDVKAGASLTSAGTVVMSARSAGKLSVLASAEANGGVGVVVGTSTIDIKPVNEVLIGAGARVLAYGDIWLSAGRSGDYVSDWYELASRIDSYSSAAIPVDDIDAIAFLYQTNLIDVAAGALLQTAGEARLHAERLGIADTEVGAAGHSWAANLFSAPSAFEKGDSLAEAHGTVRMNGTVQTGIQRRQDLTLLAWDNGSATTAPRITGFIASDGTAESVVATARSSADTYTFVLTYDGVDYTVSVTDLLHAADARVAVQNAVNTAVGAGKITVTQSTAGAIGFTLPANASVNATDLSAAQTALTAAWNATTNTVAATSFTIRYEGHVLNVSVAAATFVPTTQLPGNVQLAAHVQTAVDAAMGVDNANLAARYGNRGDIRVAIVGSAITLERGALARPWHTLGRFEPGMSTGSLTVQSQLAEELAFAQSEKL